MAESLFLSAARRLVNIEAGLGGGTSFVIFASSLRAAQSTSRIAGDDRHIERRKWQHIDYEILGLVQDFLSYLDDTDGSETMAGDAWTEGDAVCDLLRGMIPVVAGMKYVEIELRAGTDLSIQKSAK